PPEGISFSQNTSSWAHSSGVSGISSAISRFISIFIGTSLKRGRVRPVPFSNLSAELFGNNAHDLVMAAAAAGGAGCELLHLSKFSLHVGETAVLEQSIFNIR